MELIDVLWLTGHAMVAAFEIEHMTSLYSGSLRLSDLLVLQPNLNIPRDRVAPEERRAKLLIAVNRPTLTRLSPPLAEVCRYSAFSSGALSSRMFGMITQNRMRSKRRKLGLWAISNQSSRHR
jgi:hypothetical protein